MESKSNPARDMRKILYIGLSILVAVTFWIFVDLTGDSGSPRKADLELKGVPIEYKNTELLSERGLMVLDEGTDMTVDLVLTGSRWDISYIDKSQVKVTIDLTDVTGVGIQRLTPTITYPDGTKGVQRKDMTPANPSVAIGELYSKTVEVRCQRVGNVADGYSAGELEISPDKLEIRGLQEAVDPVAYAKVVLNYNNAASTIVQELDFQFYDEENQLLSSEGIRPLVDKIQVTLPVNVIKELDLRMNFIESPGARIQNINYNIQPNKILVSGDADQLRDVDHLILSDFELVQLNSDTYYNYSIPLPDGCENLSGVSRAVLQVSFKDMASATITTSNFRCDHVPKGKTAKVLTEQITATIFGTTEDVESVNSNNLTVTADLTDFNSAAGTYTVPAIIQFQSKGDLGVTGDYQLRVSITEDPKSQETETRSGTASSSNNPSTPATSTTPNNPSQAQTTPTNPTTTPSNPSNPTNPSDLSNSGTSTEPTEPTTPSQFGQSGSDSETDPEPNTDPDPESNTHPDSESQSQNQPDSSANHPEPDSSSNDETNQQRESNESNN